MTDVSTNCIFCRIARGEMGTEFVAESEHAVAFRDLQPQAPTHVLVAPRDHIPDLQRLAPGQEQLGGELLMLANEVARREGVVESGYRVLTNNGAAAGQTIFHLHFHVLGGREMSEGLV